MSTEYNDLINAIISKYILQQEAAVEAQKTEEELQQKILKENAELSKAINIREESKRSLNVYQNRSREDRKLLNIEKKVHYVSNIYASQK